MRVIANKSWIAPRIARCVDHGVVSVTMQSRRRKNRRGLDMRRRRGWREGGGTMLLLEVLLEWESGR